jgi:hypothetical protein
MAHYAGLKSVRGFQTGTLEMMFTSYDYEFYFIKFYQIYEQHVKFFSSGVANCSSLNDLSHLPAILIFVVRHRKQRNFAVIPGAPRLAIQLNHEHTGSA